MKKKLVFLLILASSFTRIDAQVRRSDWQYGVVLETDNPVYVIAAYYLTSEIPSILMGTEETVNFIYKNRWWYPLFIRHRANIINKLEFDNGKASVYPKGWGFDGIDWRLLNYTVGYHLGYLSRVSPFGFDIQASYSQDGFRVRMPSDEKAQNVVKKMVSGTALLRIRMGKYETASINPVLEIGGRYDHAFHYHDNTIDDKDAVNNGFTGIVGLGFTTTNSHVSWSLRYEHAFYDYYNKDFTFNGVPIFSGAKSTFGKLGASVSYGF